MRKIAGTGRQDAQSRSPFLLTRAGTAVTTLAVIALYLIVMVMPVFGIAFGAVGDHCSGSPGLVCQSTGEKAARLAPSVGATSGLLVAAAGCFIPPLREHRLRWLLLGYGLALAGIVTGALIAGTGQ
ncbi:MAG: hypothetical protein HKP61_17790 [Dactylosporangium sp.]|nr:hypothetical protein [Dactylosporangium sp.]NNJ62750.1 hypothetical protein [Dactylosporangium sp.]